MSFILDRLNLLISHTSCILDAAIGFAVVAMQAIDIDTNADLYYNFTSDVSAYNMAGQLVDVQVYNYLDLFRIDSAGQVFVNGRLDVSKVQRIIYGVQAIDKAAISGPVQRGEGMFELFCVTTFFVGLYVIDESGIVLANLV